MGATASIYAEYQEEGLLRLERAHPDHVPLAAALMHGLRSETCGLLSAGREDYTAAAYLAELSWKEVRLSSCPGRRIYERIDVRFTLPTGEFNVHGFICETTLFKSSINDLRLAHFAAILWRRRW